MNEPPIPKSPIPDSSISLLHKFPKGFILRGMIEEHGMDTVEQIRREKQRIAGQVSALVSDQRRINEQIQGVIL